MKPHVVTLAAPRTALERLPEEWAARLGELGEPAYRGKQVFRWIHHRGVWDAAAMTDLSKGLREKIAEEPGLAMPLEIQSAHDSSDGTRKLLVRSSDQRTVETVLIPMPRGGAAGDAYVDDDTDGAGRDGRLEGDERGDDHEGAEDDRCGDVAGAPDAPLGRAADGDGSSAAPTPFTQCISSQVGCAMGCVFCASGIAGLKRHLTAAEIVGQVLLGRREVPAGSRLRNVVFMGMGEPLANYDAVARALVLLTHPDGLGLSKRRVTVSTSGLVPEIDRLGRDFGGQVQLAVSLHAPDDARRSAIMPINKKYPLRELLGALERYPLPKRRRITIEYTLIRGFNAAPADAAALARVLRRIPSKVNLIPMNAIEGNPLEAPSWDDVDRFQAALRDHGVFAFVRRRKGDDIAAACGQLALRGEPRKVRVALPTIAER